MKRRVKRVLRRHLIKLLLILSFLYQAAPLTAVEPSIEIGKTYWLVSRAHALQLSGEPSSRYFQLKDWFKADSFTVIDATFAEYQFRTPAGEIGHVQKSWVDEAVRLGVVIDYEPTQRQIDERRALEEKRAVSGRPKNEPEDFRGIPWGASIEDVRKVVPQLPNYAGLAHGDRVKVFFGASGRIGDVVARFAYSFLDDKFAEVTIYFKSSDFRIIRDAFIERYGKPTSIETIPLQTGLGSKYENERLIWQGKTIVIRLDRYGSKVTDGQAKIGTKEILDYLLDLYRNKGKAAAKDL